MPQHLSGRSQSCAHALPAETAGGGAQGPGPCSQARVSHCPAGTPTQPQTQAWWSLHGTSYPNKSTAEARASGIAGPRLKGPRKLCSQADCRCQGDFFDFLFAVCSSEHSDSKLLVCSRKWFLQINLSPSRGVASTSWEPILEARDSSPQGLPISSCYGFLSPLQYLLGEAWLTQCRQVCLSPELALAMCILQKQLRQKATSTSPGPLGRACFDIQ